MATFIEIESQVYIGDKYDKEKSVFNHYYSLYSSYYGTGGGYWYLLTYSA